jgi:hypothetical protein
VNPFYWESSIVSTIKLNPIPNEKANVALFNFSTFYAWYLQVNAKQFYLNTGKHESSRYCNQQVDVKKEKYNIPCADFVQPNLFPKRGL